MPIPANDDSLRCIQVIAGSLGKAGERGHKKRIDAAQKGRILYNRVKLEPLSKLSETQTLESSKSRQATVIF